MKYLFLVSMMVLSLACNKSDDKKGGGDGKGKVVNTEGVDVTDRSKCVGPAAAGASIQNGSWKTVNTNDGTTITQILSATTNSVSIKAICTRGNVQVTATATGSARITSSTLEILSSDSVTAETTMDNLTLSCTAKVERSAEVNYTFVGPCLKLFSSEGELITPPAL